MASAAALRYGCQRARLARRGIRPPRRLFATAALSPETRIARFRPRTERRTTATTTATTTPSSSAASLLLLRGIRDRFPSPPPSFGGSTDEASASSSSSSGRFSASSSSSSSDSVVDPPSFSAAAAAAAADAAPPVPPPPRDRRGRRRRRGATTPIDDDGYDPETTIANVRKASVASRNDPNGRKEFVREALRSYEDHLRFVLEKLGGGSGGGPSSPAADRRPPSPSSSFAERVHPDPVKRKFTRDLLSPPVASRAFRAILRTRHDTPILSRDVRRLERLVGTIGLTPLADELSFRLLAANAKAGNVGRTIQLLRLRTGRGYPPKVPKEFGLAVTAVHAAGLSLRRDGKLIESSSSSSSSPSSSSQSPSSIENPTRWLDAVLLNMHERGVQLTVGLANSMLETYGSTGRTDRAEHSFYKVKRDPVSPYDRIHRGPYDRVNKRYVDEKDGRASRVISPEAYEAMPKLGGTGQGCRVRMKMNKRPPPYRKVPSEAKGKSFEPPDLKRKRDGGGGSSTSREGEDGGGGEKLTKLQNESRSDYSPTLTAAFAFADSLTLGACGHDPIALNAQSYDALIKVCATRGALSRAERILRETMPSKGLEPTLVGYTRYLAGLARVGDVTTMRETLLTMTNRGMTPDWLVVEALASAHLDVGDVSGAVTIVQDMFNQYSVLPPSDLHLKILNFALARDLVHEAKRHVYFVQQLWKWEPTPHDAKGTIEAVKRFKEYEPLSKESLVRLFEYFGEDLTEEDFF